ncbi:MAG: outer membrane lipoprotein-sorting protein [Cyclobacteriaceae bacterium]|jgi:outer membrane lipoprotein-sorting protein|nr:outer membrane lipoprotein-sorting protein [Flammeovirgaceae bacterium]
MKTKLLVFALALVAGVAQAQTADEILAKYFENTGGVDKWNSLNGIKMVAKVNQGGMEIPLEIVQLKDGRQMTKITFQGKVIMQGVYDGTTLWSHNFMTMKAEKSDAESTENFKKEIGEFPDAFLNYKGKGYKAELLGKETVDGTETYKIKLVKKPILVDGKETENVVFYYFDAENFVPLMTETEIKSGPAKGMVSQSKMSDYQEVSGLMMPFSMSQGVKGQPGQPLTITAIELNPAVDAAAFKFPEGQ